MMNNLCDLKTEYDIGGDFKDYVNKYGKKHGIIDVIDILKCAIVRDYYVYCKEKEKIHEPDSKRNSEFFKAGECT